MIGKRELLAMAQRTSLTPHVVEKDYVLGWMLAGIYGHKDLAESWLFKGGTCLKKCFFETYRFSEDLDFTLRKPDHLDANFLKGAFSEIGDWIYDQTGIEIPADKQEFDIYQNPRGQISCQGKISYKGPVSSTHALPRIKLDLTADERVVLPPVRTQIFHPYSDSPEDGIEVLAYDYIEAFAENSEHSRNGHAHVISMMSYISTEIPKHSRNRSASWKSCAPSVNSRASAFHA